MSENSYRNTCLSINFAKPRAENGHVLVGGSFILHPLGLTFKEASPDEDESVVASTDLSNCNRLPNIVFLFEKHRRTEHDHLIVILAGGIEAESL